MSTKTDLIQQIIQLIQGVDLLSSSLSMVVSKKMNRSSDLKSLHARSVMLRSDAKIQVVYRYETKDETKNYSVSDFIVQLVDWLDSQFYNATLQIDDRAYVFLSNHKNATLKNKKMTISTKLNNHHDHQKKRLIPESADFLISLGISSSNGKVFQPAQKKYRQINKFVEIVEHLTSGQNITTIADMGCGKGYLSFAAYSYLSKNEKDLTLTGYELRPNLVEQCNEIAQSLQLKGLTFEIGNIAEIEIPQTDMVIALHACDIATDMAIAKGIEADAKVIVVSPCCHKQVRKAMKGNDELKSTLSHGIMEERLAEWLTDAIRVLLLEYKGYKAKIMEFISSEHTSKNLLITAEKSDPRPAAFDEVQVLKSQYGISEHYLERLLKK